MATGKAAIITSPEGADGMEQLTHTVLDDLLYNVVHDLLIKVHRDEKIAKAQSAALKVEKLAEDASDSTALDAKPDVRIETDAAIYEDGIVTLKGNPLKTMPDIICPRCRLPRLLYPTEGKGARKPDPAVTYCKNHPPIVKPGYDIYGQTWVQPGPGRGKKKKDMEKKLDPNGDSPSPVTADTSAKDRPPNVLSFPSATCSKCKRCILVTRLNNHMGSCIGNNGRNASRAAAQKISNGGSNTNSQAGGTPPGSQKGTPLPGSRAASPRKRSSDEFDKDESEAEGNKKKRVKMVPPPAAAAPTKKITVVKTKPPKKDKVKTGSLLSNEQKAGDVDDEKKSTVVAAGPPGKKSGNSKVLSPLKKLKQNVTSKIPGSPAKALKGEDVSSESSGTLSSPPQQ
ncbi:hypothetical protein GQ53DRAFT_827744 [Thozetella sp. PMI_491]|nr:hypothetical protein GQ53DRAFT_827744 [Thozetella sp. PMI_491]